MPTQSSRLDRTLVILTLIILVGLPLPVGSNRDWAIGLFCMFIGIVSVLWAIGQWRGTLMPSRAFKPAVPMLAMLLLCQTWVAIQWLGGLSVDSGATAEALLLGLGYTLLFLVIVSVFHTRKRVTLLLGSLVVSGTLQAFYGTFMTLAGIEWLLATPKTAYIGDATGTFVNRNSMAGYLELTLAAGIGLLLALRDTRPFSWTQLVELLMGPKARLRLALVVMVIALVMTHSRGGNASFFVALLLVGGFFILRNKENRLRNSLILVSLIVIDVLVISQYFGLERLKERVLNTRLSDTVIDGEIVQRANEIRGDVFLYALPLAQDKPITGQGAGSFEAVFPKYPSEDIRLHFDLAHNDYIQFAIEYGVLGMLPLAVFVLLALYWAFKALWQQRSLYRSGVGFAAAMGIIALLTHAMTDFNLQIPANAATFVVMCALAVLANHHSKERRKRTGSAGGPPAI